ncbi:anti-sigma factor RsbA family regulatory protein [Pseudonocardia sp.]|uniref:anti-sigma factor RsbA family regulatory protein n=1 Tax=Pseudonocardia sp. TaxID=60912 RepID=UPI003D0BFD4D
MTAPVKERPAGLWHPALYYTDQDDYLAGVVGFVREGLERGEPTLVAVPEPNLGAVREELAPAERAAVHMVDMRRAGRNPGRIIGSVLGAFVGEHPGRRVRIVGEPIWPGRSDDEYPACAEHEALINVALQDAPASVLCPYDTTSLDGGRIHDAARTHPVLIEGGRRWHSLDYADPVAVAAMFDRPLPPPPPESDIQVVGGPIGPAQARRFVHDVAARAGLPPVRVAALRSVVQELVINTIVHAGGQGLLTVWVTDEHLVCQIEDRGFLPDVLAGRRPGTPSDTGHGLRLVHDLADLVRVHRGPGGTTVRVHLTFGTEAGPGDRSPDESRAAETVEVPPAGTVRATPTGC